MSKKTDFSYPPNISDIGYASFLQIKRWSYDDAQATQMKNYNDASASIQDTNFLNMTKGLMDTVDKKVPGLFNGRDLISDYEDGFKRSWTNKIKEKGWVQRNAGELKEWTTDMEVTDEAVALDVPIPLTFEDLIGQGAEGEHNENAMAQWQAHERRKSAFEKYKKGLTDKQVNLALPNEFQYEYGADWNNTFKLGTLALLSENPSGGMKAVAAAGTIGLGANWINGQANQNTDKKSKDPAGAAGSAVRSLIDPFQMGTEANLRNLVGLAGLAPNENAMQFFKKMDFRNFDLTFQMASRNSGESIIIEKIIQWFKVAMHPGTLKGSGASVLLKFPDVFELVPKFVTVDGKGNKKVKRHPMMPRTKLCALTNLRVNATPMNQLSTTFDGSFPLITLNLRFTELTALTKGDFGQIESMQNTRAIDRAADDFGTGLFDWAGAGAQPAGSKFAEEKFNDGYYSY